MTLDSRHTLAQLSRDLALVPEDTMNAGVAAINGSIRSSIAYSARLLSLRYPGLKIGSIKHQIKAEWASARKQEQIRGAFEFSAKRFHLLSNFRATQTKRGVRVSRGPWRIETLEGALVNPAVLAHAFIQRPKRGGGAQIWIRLGSRRYPISALLAASLSTAVSETGQNLMPFILQAARERFTTVFGQRAKYLAAKREGRL